MEITPEWLRTWEAWRRVHQPFERDWWQHAIDNGHYDNVELNEEIKAIREFVSPSGNVLDIGCGPRPMFPPCTVIEPLAHEYAKFTPTEWWDGVIVHGQAAEHRIAGKFDTIVCWNCLDHAIGWKDILVNIRDYAFDLTRIYVATDFHPPFMGHPGFSREEFDQAIDELFEIVEKREPFFRDIALRLRRR